MGKNVYSTILFLALAFSLMFLNACGDKKLEEKNSDGLITKTEETSISAVNKVSESSATTSSIVNESLAKNLRNISCSDAEIKEWFLTVQDDLLKKLGDDYKTVQTGAEGTETGYYYKDLGLTFTFSNKLLWIDCDDDLIIHGIRAGMTFNEIKKVLGDTKIEDTFIETPEHKAYELRYDYDGLTICCESDRYDGSGSWIYLIRTVDERTVTEDDIKHYLSMNQNELFQNLGILYEIWDWIEDADGNRGKTGCYYEELGLDFVIDENKNMEFIDLNKYHCLYNGSTIGTNFDEIKKRLGDAPIVESVNATGGKVYELTYQFDGFILRIIAPDPEGEYCSVYIFKSDIQ